MKRLEGIPEVAEDSLKGEQIMKDGGYNYKETCELISKRDDGTEEKFALNYYVWVKGGKIEKSVALFDGKKGRIYEGGERRQGISPITDRRFLNFLRGLSKFRPYLLDAIPELREE